MSSSTFGGPNRVSGVIEVAIGLAVGVQSLTLPAPEASRSPDRLDPVYRVGGGDVVVGADDVEIVVPHPFDQTSMT